MDQRAENAAPHRQTANAFCQAGFEADVDELDQSAVLPDNAKRGVAGPSGLTS
jgi:hypothetical protein